MGYKSTEERSCYCPPILGNGEMVLAPDCEGTIHYEAKKYFPEGRIFLAGRRVWQQHKLLSFGAFGFDKGCRPESFSQELCCEEGIVRSSCQYPDGCRIDSESLIHPQDTIYALRKRFYGKETEAVYSYTLCGYDEDSEKAITNVKIRQLGQGARIAYEMTGREQYTGEILFAADRDMQVSIEDRKVEISCHVKPGESLSLFICIEDSFSDREALEAHDKFQGWEEKTGTNFFDELYEETKTEWKEYYERVLVETEDRKLNDIYRTCLYHLKCYTTRWSIPVGLYNNCWAGRYFGFDEYYSFLGLIESNQDELAKRVPKFRLKVCLQKAIGRASVRKCEEQARFPWETDEYGEEGAPWGSWLDHVFHMPLIAMGAFEYYEYTQDVGFLQDCYRMIRACAKFFTIHMIYYDGSGKPYVGRCTDLERLGNSVQNPFMTACGVIACLETLVKAADVLEVDREYRNECEKTAAELRENLPVQEGRYVPFSGCRDKSIAVFAGKFPFNVLKNEDEKLLAAWKDFLEEEGSYGNMYAVGKGVSPWYACWKAEGFARMGMAAEAYASLRQAYSSVGVFDEMFEINEEEMMIHPWFTTAAGIFLSTVNEMLISENGRDIHILPAFPGKDINVIFKLPVKGGAVVSAEIQEGKLINVDVTMKPGIEPKGFRIYYQGRKMREVTGRRTG